LTQVYRILRAAYAGEAFDGEGAYLYGGRWSSAGTRLCYTSEHQSLAMVEYFVHLDSNDAPAILFWLRQKYPRISLAGTLR
jgi:RES domain-containing protein